MLRKFGISQRFVGATVVTVVLVVGAILGLVDYYVQRILHSSEQRELEAIYQTMVHSIESEGQTAVTLSALVAGMPRVQEAFANGDRAALKAIFLDGFATLKKAYGVRQFQFHTPPAISFLRVHKPEKFSDDLSSFRKTVVETNASKHAVQGLEAGVAGLGVRGIVPVFHQGRHLGSIEFGMSFGQPFIDRFAADYGVDVALYLQRNGRFDRFASTLGDARLLSDDERRAVIAGNSSFGRMTLKGMPVSVLADVVRDYSGNPIGVLEIAKDRSDYQRQFADLSYLLIGLGLAAVLVISLLSWIISRGVVRPVLSAARSMEDVASGEGNLGLRLDESGNDEVSRLAKAYNRFAGTIEQLVDRVSQTSGQLGAVVDDLSSLSEHTDRGVKRQQEQTAQVATAMTEMSATVREVAHNATQTANAAAEADEQARSGGKVVSETMESINALAADVGRAVEMTRRVKDDSESIGSVLDVIRGIAEQTNLLALNAAIEAARAGEQGRGFAVVADEVRSLAQRTQQSTQEIQEMIERLQGGVNETVSVMEASQQQAVVSVSEAEKARNALDAITHSVDSITEMSAQIATASEEQSAVAEEINRNVVAITQVADQTAVDSDKSSEVSTKLARQVEDLLALVSQFHTGNDEIQELVSAKVAHRAWKTRVRRFLDGRETLDEQVAFSHEKCGLGRWYETVGREKFSHLPAMKALQAPHRELHDTIRRIAELKRQGDMAGAERAYEKVGPLSEQIVSLIEEVERQLH